MRTPLQPPANPGASATATLFDSGAVELRGRGQPTDAAGVLGVVYSDVVVTIRHRWAAPGSANLRTLATVPTVAATPMPYGFALRPGRNVIEVVTTTGPADWEVSCEISNDVAAVAAGGGSSGGGFVPGGAKRIPFANAAGDALIDSPDLTYDDATNDLTLSVSESGGTVGLTVANSSNTANSAAEIIAQVAGASAADAVFRTKVAGVTTWSWGTANGDSDKWKLAPGSDIGTSPAMEIDTSGQIGVGAAPATGRRMVFGGNVTSYNRFLKTGATAGTWEFGVGAVLVTADNHFTITDNTSSFLPRITILGTQAGNQTGDVCIGPLASATVPAVVATNATGGFLRLSTCAGTPTGAAIDGSLVLDTTNNKLYVRSTGNWVALN